MSGASPIERLRSLASTAMIGTDRSAETPAKVLCAAALLGAQARAGLRPQRIEGRLRERPEDPTPIAGPAPMATLMRLLGNPDAGLIEEWAVLAGRRGVRVADATVPLLLDWWARQPRRTSDVFAATGTCGAWLASLNADWAKPVVGSAVPSDADDVWQTGKAPERAALLLTVRRVDPARALEMVRSTWQNDGADERRRFIEVLAERCSMADEPFLENALDVRSKVVRRQAACALALIRGSRLRARMTERAKAMVSVDEKGRLLKRMTKIALTLPAAFDKDWERDGIEEQAASGTGKRAWWMRQILGGADLELWTDVTSLEPERVLDSLSKDECFADALAALNQRASADGDVAWCRVLMQHALRQDRLDHQVVLSLVARLPIAHREGLLLEAAQHKHVSLQDRWLILSGGEERWSAEYSINALRLLSGRKTPDETWQLFDCAERVSRLIAPQVAEQFAEALTQMFPDTKAEGFRKSIDRARLRAEMDKEFAP